MKKYLFTLIFLFFALIGKTQPIYLISTGGTVNNCVGDFYDSGGGGGNYGAGENFTMTFHSTSGTNTHTKMSFSLFDVDPSDTLFVYDGPTTAAPLIGKYNNANPLAGTAIISSIYNVSGDLTFNFKSNGVTQASGWFASLVCIPICQTVLAAFDTLVTDPLPDDSGYIDICHGDTITFAALGTGAGVFPQNGILYSQTAATSLFIWNFGDGLIDTGQVLNHYYNAIHGYDVTLTVIDVNGCMNTNYIPIRVRISGNPIGTITPLPNICPQSDTIEITVGYGVNNIIQVVPVVSNQAASQSFDSTMFIPDGPACGVQCYNTNITFTCFTPGQTITSPADILSICVTMEHSYAGDLGFTIFCPNGQNVILDPNTHSGGAFMGVPMGGVNHDLYDSNTAPCDPASNPPGVGWPYCWSEIYPTAGTLDALTNGTSPIDSTIQSPPSHYIAPNNSFAGLIGCPLNGTWNIQICDDFQIDNGYIFNWTLNLDPSLLPSGWSYDVPIDSIGWIGNYIIGSTDTSIFVLPDSGGDFYYTMSIYDAFGCRYDTTLHVNVFPKTNVDAGTDQVICNGADATLNTTSVPAGTTYLWSTGETTQSITVHPSGTLDYYVTVTDVNGCIGKDTVKVTIGNNPQAVIDAPTDVCVDEINFIGSNSNVGTPDVINTYAWSFDDSGTSTLTNPSHTYGGPGTYNVSLIVVTDNGCIDTSTHTITIHVPISVYIGPDTILGSGQAITVSSSLIGPGYTYLWSTGETTPTIQVTMPGTYSVTVTDPYGCIATDVMEVFPGALVIPNIITPNGDGKNDVFKITNLYQYPNSKLLIYNRWGKKIYESDNYQCDWGGDNHSDGVYYYILDVSDGKSYHGTITLIR